LAIRNITQKEMEKLEENVSYVEEKHKRLGTMLSEQDFFDLDLWNNNFHRLIAKSTHNPILCLTVDYIMDFIPECETRHLFLDVNFSLQNIKEHHDILDALKSGDAEKCAKKMIHHLDRLAAYLVKVKNGSVEDNARSSVRTILNTGTRLPKMTCE
jgi:DNA-binding GntR family transcriptional regulator